MHRLLIRPGRGDFSDRTPLRGPAEITTVRDDLSHRNPPQGLVAPTGDSAKLVRETRTLTDLLKDLP